MIQSVQPGLPNILSASKWGFNNAILRVKQFKFTKPFATWVIENVTFKIMPCEGHALTATEAAVQLKAEPMRRRIRRLRIEDIVYIRIRKMAPALLITHHTGTLKNSAARDHCMQYMVAVALIKGGFSIGDDYLDEIEYAESSLVVHLRAKMTLEEKKQFTMVGSIWKTAAQQMGLLSH